MLDKPFSGYIYKVEGDCWSIRSHGSFFLESGSYVFIQDSKNQKCSGVIFDFQQINIFDNQYMEFSSQDLVAFPELEKIILFEYKAYQVTSSQGKPICNQAVLMHESLSYSFLLHNFNWLERIFLLTNNIYEQKKELLLL